jgi:Zn ribbon nucleic-acid-binding protein
MRRIKMLNLDDTTMDCTKCGLYPEVRKQIAQEIREKLEKDILSIVNNYDAPCINELLGETYEGECTCVACGYRRIKKEWQEFWKEIEK